VTIASTNRFNLFLGFCFLVLCLRTPGYRPGY